jgi:hypothetical protein
MFCCDDGRVALFRAAPVFRSRRIDEQFLYENKRVKSDCTKKLAMILPDQPGLNPILITFFIQPTLAENCERR